METFLDENIRELMWNSKIPIKIDMAIEDINDVEIPNSLFFNFPRIGYITNILKEVKSHYEKYLPPNTVNEDIWFELNKIPLKWNLPFGVLIDNINQKNYDLPINIIVHFRSLPEDKIQKFKKIDSLKTAYLNSLKESMSLKYGTSEKILNLPINETNKLFDIICNDGVKMIREYNEINRNFFDTDLKVIRYFIKFLLYFQKNSD